MRFPINKKLVLVTTAGLISCEIVRANEKYLFVKDVKYQGVDLGKLYIDRNSIVAFSDLEEEKAVTESNSFRSRIINFGEMLKKRDSYGT